MKMKILIPAADDTMLEDALRKMRDHVRDHRNEARQILRDLPRDILDPVR